jgi:glycine dehydrogenase subunit 2
VVARIEGLAEAHPYRPDSLAQGILEVIDLLQRCLLEITGMDAITLQPAAGAHGEFTGILLVRAWHESQGNPRRKVLIPDSAHGTNPATAAICGYTVENLKSNAEGGIDLEALTRQVDEETAALMLTNPSTIGVFESQIHKIADILHAKGALLYMDGANMNALVGKARPGDFGVDVMHLNLHKTFSTPHGGGGPGSGPVACKAFLEPFLPIPVLVRNRGRGTEGLGTKGHQSWVAPIPRFFETGTETGPLNPDFRGHSTSLELRPSPIRRPRPRLLRQHRHVHPRAGLHPGQRPRRPAPDH